MKSFYAPGLWAMLGLIGIAQPLIAAEPFGSASLLPLPSANVVQAGYGGYQEPIYSPSDQAPQPPRPAAEGYEFGPPPPSKLSGDYESAMKQSWSNGGCADGSCGDACLPGRACPRFYGYAGGLVLGRANQCDTAITQQVGTYETIMSTRQADQQWAGGVEGRIGWVMPNCCNAVEIGYWGIYPGDQMAAVHAPNYTGGIRPALGVNLDQLWYNDGTTGMNVYDWMSSTGGMHYLSRSFDYHNVEANFLGNTYAWGVVPFGSACGDCNGCGAGACGPRCVQFGWLAGFRYFQFNEGMSLYTDYNDTMIGDYNDVDELCYHVRTNNTLLGFQMGGQGSWYVTNCLSLYGGGRFGVFNNHVESNQYIHGLGGDATINSGTYAGEAYRYNSSRNALAGIGQIDLGMRYQLGCHWSFTGGYRVLGIAGVATAPSQVPDNFADPRYVQNICANDSVILHGAYLGGQFAW